MNKIHGVTTVGLAFAALTALNAVGATAEPDIVYLNRCIGNCTVQAGATDDAINGTSTLVNQTVGLVVFPYSDTTFDATAACVRTLLAPYNVVVRILPPGSVARREIMLTGTTSLETSGIAGLSYDSRLDGHAHDNIIAFVFAGTIGDSVDGLCWYTAQAIGNVYGMDFVTSCPDIMYNGASSCGLKSYSNQDAACTGSISGNPGKCILGNMTQNSAATLSVTPGPTDILFANGAENFEQPASGPSP